MGNSAGKLGAIVFDFDGTLAELHLDFAEMKRKLAELAGEFLPPVAAVRPESPPRTRSGVSKGEPTGAVRPEISKGESTATVRPEVSKGEPARVLPPVLEWMKDLEDRIAQTGEDGAAEYRGRAEALIVGLEMEAAERGSLFPFTRQILSSLRQRGVRTAIITRNCEAAVRKVFPDIDDFCAVFLARDHVPHPKPDPDHLLRALVVLGAAPASAIMVGDHPIDIRTGVRAGIRTGGVCTGDASRSELIESGADFTASDCKELIGLLEGEGLI